jgi:hypothetical protein
MSGEALLATPARPLYEPSHRRPKKEPIFGFRAYSRSEPLGLMLAPRHQVTRFGELLPISEMGQNATCRAPIDHVRYDPGSRREPVGSMSG